MKTLLRVLVFVALFGWPARGGDAAHKKLHVLFIGNSLTYVNDLPAMIASMAAAKGDELTIDRNLVGGATLEKHWQEGKALAKIKAEHWDYVVLQDLSTEAYTNREAMFKNGRLFDAEIRKAGARTMLYMTWALETAPEKFPVIEEAYTSLGKELTATVVPVGAAWHKLTAVEGKPAIQLYKPDHKHPAPAGTYLAACVFYRALFGAPSVGLPATLEKGTTKLVALSKEEAPLLQKTADAVPIPTP
jgi:hypothetical protein